MKRKTSVVLGRSRLPSLDIPGELFLCYQPVVGSQAILVWLNLRWLAKMGDTDDVEDALQRYLGLDFKQLAQALQRLQEADLLEIGENGGYILHEPLSVELFAKRFAAGAPATGASEAAAAAEQAAPAPPPAANARAELARGKAGGKPPAAEAGADTANPAALPPAPAETPPAARRRDTEGSGKARRSNTRDQLSAAMRAVMQICEKTMGVVGSSHFEKLLYWVEDMGMESEVVGLAIEEAARSARTRHISYIEGILRNWHKEGILTLRDALNSNVSRILAGDIAGQQGSGRPMEGVPNADAYRRVDPAQVQKWKELYPDEYDS